MVRVSSSITTEQQVPTASKPNSRYGQYGRKIGSSPSPEKHAPPPKMYDDHEEMNQTKGKQWVCEHTCLVKGELKSDVLSKTSRGKTPGISRLNFGHRPVSQNSHRSSSIGVHACWAQLPTLFFYHRPVSFSHRRR
mmetsp:Transcript_44515/g.71545  ORF Transcript_44515/g.71545 Transcript_44515/m.71545 type:complete len:136 (+) Transcript_44515:255-662(+)